MPCTGKINVPPLRESELCEVVSRPAALLSARFETERLAAQIARRAAEESAKDAGALPLLSYLLDDMWTQMVERGDGVLRLPPQAMELGGVLAERANAFLASHPKAEEALRRVLTLKLATVREDGEPTRRRARARSSPMRNGDWSASWPTIRTGCWSRQRPRAAKPMPRWRTRRFFGDGTSCASG